MGDKRNGYGCNDHIQNLKHILWLPLSIYLSKCLYEYFFLLSVFPHPTFYSEQPIITSYYPSEYLFSFFDKEI